MLASDIARRRGHLSWISKDQSQKKDTTVQKLSILHCLFSLLRHTNYWKVFLPSTSLWMYQLRMIYTQRIFQKQYYYHITYAYCMCNGSSLSWVSVSTAKQNFNCFLSCFPGVDAACHEKKAIEKEVGTL